MVLKANDRRTSSPCHDEFRGPRSDCVRQKLPPSKGAPFQAFLRMCYKAGTFLTLNSPDVSERVFIDVVLRSYTRSIGDGSRHFEPR
ncbi:hypothetical protein TNCV_3054031 [Trichonephila clavipes]|nr:hypothetical protein TNCV_3054031 [Trichonephila clavipes]